MILTLKSTFTLTCILHPFPAFGTLMQKQTHESSRASWVQRYSLLSTPILIQQSTMYHDFSFIKCILNANVFKNIGFSTENGSHIHKICNLEPWWQIHRFQLTTTDLMGETVHLLCTGLCLKMLMTNTQIMNMVRTVISWEGCRDDFKRKCVFIHPQVCLKGKLHCFPFGRL